MRKHLYKIFLIITLLALFVCAGIISARADTGPTIIYVTEDGTSGETSWEDTRSLSEALSYISECPNAEIWVAEGTYSVPSYDGEASPFSINTSVKIYGGFKGDESALEDRHGGASILSGDSTAAVVRIESGDYSPHVEIDGFTITGGGGDCGGGIYISDSHVSIENCALVNNSAVNGGGIWNHSSSLSLSPDVTVTNCTFSGNSATENGGGIWNSDGNVRITNCTFSENSASENGGGAIYNVNSSTSDLNLGLVKVVNSILWGNSSEIAHDTGAFSTPIVTHSVVSGGYTGIGNINSDPKLKALGSDGKHTTVSADVWIYGLLPNSSAIDAGTDDGAPATDQRGVFRPQGSRFDAGSYEYEKQGAVVVVFPDVEQKLKEDGGDVAIKFGTEGIEAPSDDKYQAITSVSDDRTLTVRSVQMDNAPT